MYRLSLILLLVTTIFAANRIAGQDARATVGGLVADTQGGRIPNARVTVVSDDTGVNRTTVSNGEGLWQAQFLLPGHYHFTVSAPGFKTEVRRGIELHAADIKSFDVQLSVGSEAQSVTVIAGDSATLIDTSAAVSGAIINSKELEELPTQSHLVTLFATLSAGVQQQDQGTNVIRPWSNTAASQYETNGGRNSSWTNSFLLDGMPNTKGGGEISFLPPVDSIQEFRVQTNAYDSSIGRQSGATMNMATRSGGKAYHGVLYEHNQNSMLNARVWGDTSGKPLDVHYNQFGGTFGGPVWIPKVYNGKDRTFFFVSFDKTFSRGPESQIRSVPTALERSGDFSQTWTSQLVNGTRQISYYHIYNPFVVVKTPGSTYGNRAEFGTFGAPGGEVIPQSLLNPVAQAILKFVPLPNHANDGTCSTCNNYWDVATNAATFPEFAARVDQNWNNNHHSFLMVGYSNLNQDQPNHFHTIATGQYLGRTSERLALDHTWTISPTVVLDLRANVARFYSPNYYNGAGYDPTQLGMPSSFASLLKKPSFPYITGIAGTGTNSGTNANFGTSEAGSTSADTNYTWGATMTQVLGRHTLHYGAEYWILQSASGGIGKPGQFDFDGSWTKPNYNQSCGTAQCSATASFLLGLPAGGNLPINASALYSQHFYAGFVQEDWRMTSKLTINVGMRYDLQTGVTERFDRLTDRYDPNAVNPIDASAKTAYQATVASSPDLQTYMPAANFVSRGALLFAGVNGTPRGANDSNGQWQPRLGFAYQIRPNTVIKGGWGRFAAASYNKGNQNGFSTSTSLVASQDSQITPWDTLSNPFRNGVVQPTGSSLGAMTNLGSAPTWDDPNLGRLYNWQASLQLQQQVGRWLMTVGGSYENQQAISVAWNMNQPSFDAWKTLQQPVFNTDGTVVGTLRWNNKVSNPYYKLPGVTGGTIGSSSTISMNQLLNPIPYLGTVNQNRPTGQNHYYALQSQVERRYRNGFSFNGAFTWSKMFEDTSFIGPQIAGNKIEHKLGGEDRPFNLVLSGIWDLPIGRGKLVGGNMPRILDSIVGGWEINGKFGAQSGLVDAFSATAGYFWSGKSAALSKDQRTYGQYFDTSQFVAFPTSSTDTTNYPTWTGLQSMPGGSYHSTGSIKNATYNDFAAYIQTFPSRWGNIRQQGIVSLDTGVYKNVPIHDAIRLQLRMSAFNVTNHPRFGAADTNPSSSTFGQVPHQSTVNQARTIELGGKLYF
jgi:hypothetical protein